MLGAKKRKDRKTQKSRREEKVVGFSSASLGSLLGWNQGDRLHDLEENPGS